MGLSAIVLIIAFAIFALAIYLLRQLSDTAPADRYRVRGPLLSPAERSFFGVLQQATNGELLIFAKVRVADVLAPDKALRGSKWQIAFNRINAKHFDFLLCDPAEVAPRLVIELDDASHAKDKRKARDAFLDAACASAKLPLLRVDAQAAYSIPELEQLLEQRLRPPEPTLAPVTSRGGRMEPRL